MKRNNGSKKSRRGKKKGSNVVARISKSIMGPPLTKLVRLTTYITSVNASSALNFTTGGNPYYNLSNFMSAGDYTAQAASFQFARVRAIRVDINRVIPETQIVTVYAAGVLPSLQIAFFPALNSATVSNVQNVETTLIFNPFNNIGIHREWRYPSIQSVGTLDGNIVAFDPTKWFTTQATDTMGGELHIAQTGVNNALNATSLYSVLITMEFQFAGPF